MTPLAEPGDVIDGFRIEERIHAGGMGVIYRVTHPDHDFPIIMKVPRLGPGEPAASVITYEVEAMIMAALRGPHVPLFIAAGDLAKQAYIVMEYVQGPSLAKWADEAPLPLDQVIRIGSALATAVHAMHLQDAIHLDLKPSNVIMRESGEAVLIDFGLAHHGHYPDLLAEEIRNPVGSAPYISPEQLRGVRSNPQSDVFALGAILYQLATGRLPFGSPSSRPGLRQRLYRDPIPPRAIVPDVPPFLQEVILHALEPDPEKRYASAAQVAFDLSHGDQVALGPRAQRKRRVAGLGGFLRWVAAAGFEPPMYPSGHPSVQVSGASIIMAAVATAHHNEAQFEAQRQAVRRLMGLDEHTRLAAVTSIPPAPELGNEEDVSSTSQRIQQLVLLRNWAESLDLPASRVTFHVLESGDPAVALLDYARMNGVDHIVIGGPPPDLPLKGVQRTVAAKVALEAPCTVTVVRSHAPAKKAEFPW